MNTVEVGDKNLLYSRKEGRKETEKEIIKQRMEIKESKLQKGK